jgi:sec-independent protein translocase protein TatB
MLDIGWTELALIAVVALIAIGPKDLPYALRTVGSWIRKARLLTREFQSGIDEMIREAELEDVRKKALELKNANLARQVENTIDPTGSLRNAFDPSIDARRDGQAASDAAPTPAEMPEAAGTPVEQPVQVQAPAQVPIQQSQTPPIGTAAPVESSSSEKRT